MKNTVINILFLMLVSSSSMSQKLYMKTGPNGKTGFLNKNGEIVVDYIYDQVYGFKNDLSKVNINNFYGFINKQGEIVIPAIYESASDFYKGISKVYRNGQVGYLTKTGELKYGWYDYLGNIEYNLSLIRKNSKYAYINDLTGKPVTGFYDYIEAFDNNGHALAGNNGTYFYINKKGKRLGNTPVQ